MIKSIDGAVFSRMMLSAAAEIDLNKQKVNELNAAPSMVLIMVYLRERPVCALSLIHI